MLKLPKKENRIVGCSLFPLTKTLNFFVLNQFGFRLSALDFSSSTKATLTYPNLQFLKAFLFKAFSNMYNGVIYGK